MLRVIELSVRKKQKLYSVNEAFDINPDFGSIAERENKILKKWSPGLCWIART